MFNFATEDRPLLDLSQGIEPTNSVAKLQVNEVIIAPVSGLSDRPGTQLQNRISWPAAGAKTPLRSRVINLHTIASQGRF